MTGITVGDRSNESQNMRVLFPSDISQASNIVT